MKQNDNDVIFGKTVFHLNQRRNGTSCRIAAENTFFFRQFSGVDSAVFIRYFLEVVYNAHIIIFRDDVFADTLGNVGVGMVVMQLSRLMKLF